jgi:hypothetical protein
MLNNMQRNAHITKIVEKSMLDKKISSKWKNLEKHKKPHRLGLKIEEKF